MGGGYAKYYLVLMFALFISLQGWGQVDDDPIGPPEEEYPCDYIRPLNVVNNFITPTAIPCTGNELDPDLGPVPQPIDKYQIDIIDGLASGGYNIISDKLISVSTVILPPGSNQQGSQFFTHTYNIRFLEGGWHNITVSAIQPSSTRGNSQYICEESVTIQVPVLCACPSQTYTVLGNPYTKTQINTANINSVGNGINYVIGDLEFNSNSGNLSLTNKKFIVLGKNRYFGNAPGGEVFGPTIRLTSKNMLNNMPIPNKLILIQGTTATQSYFKGDPCFGMWKGIEVDDSLGSQTRIFSTTVEDAYVGIRTIVGSSGALGFDNLRINDCIYGMISTRNAAGYYPNPAGSSSFYQILINSSPKGLLKPFDYEVNSPNRAFDNPVNKVFTQFFTKIGVWQTTNTLNEFGNVFVDKSLIGIRWGDGTSIGGSTINSQKYWVLYNCHLTGIHLRVDDYISIKPIINIRPLFDGDKVTHQILSILNEFNGEPLVVNAMFNNLPKVTYHYGIYSEIGNSLIRLNNAEIYDLIPPRQSIYKDRPVGIYTKGMTITSSLFIFNNNYQYPYGSNSIEGDINSAEITGVAIIVDAIGRTAANSCTLSVKNCIFRNCEETVSLRYGRTLINDFVCNYIYNSKRILNAVRGGSFVGPNQTSLNNRLNGQIGWEALPAGNKVFWNSAFFGNPNLISLFSFNPNIQPLVNYFGYSGELTAIPNGDILLPSWFSEPDPSFNRCPLPLPLAPFNYTLDNN